MRKRAMILASAGLLALASTNALACNVMQLEADLRWCLDGREGRGDIAGGAHVRDAAQLERGWDDCDQSESANNNFAQCTAGQKIDMARSILGIH